MMVVSEMGIMVAHDAAGAGRRQTDGTQNGLLIVIEHLDHDGEPVPMVPQGGTGGEADGAPMMKITAGRTRSLRRTWR